jgi:uncharacterized membrane protein
MNKRIGLTAVDRAAIAVIAGAATITGALYTRLPEVMPIHFGLDGRPDGFAPRAVAAWILPVISLTLWGFVRFGARLLAAPIRARYEASPIPVAALMSSAFMAGLQLCVLAAALGDGSFGRGFALLLALFWGAMGLLFPKVRRNPFLGVRVRWTLRSDENWARTHRFAGQCCMAGAAVALFGAVIGSVAVAITAVIVSGLAPVVYSWWMSRRA